MKINIYYGGRGLIEDPTIYVLNKVIEVLQELRVEVERYNLYEHKTNITTMPNTLKQADAIILAVNIEWLGIGGYMQQFLDACWMYADKEVIKNQYMFPVVIANTYGEKEAELSLIKAWEYFGGIVTEGICAYVENQVDFETDADYASYIEKKAENLYRVIQKKSKGLPSSNYLVSQIVPSTNKIELTPQESEQLSMYVSDDTYVKKQKEDIEELANLFKGMLKQSNTESKEEYIEELKRHFKPTDNYLSVSYAIQIAGEQKTLIIEVNQGTLKCYYGDKPEAEVIAKATKETMNKLVSGRITLQGAFMSGEVSAKGNFKTLRTFDQIFQFSSIV